MFFRNFTINENIIGNIPPLSAEQTKIILNQLEKAVCKIYKTKTNITTGFLLKMPYPDQFSLLPVLITTNHFLNIEDLKKQKELLITFDNDKIVKNIKLDEPRIIYSNSDQDYYITIIEIKPRIDNLYLYFDIDENIFEDNYINNFQNKPIYILQYPNGRESSHSLGLVKNIIDSNIIHSCSTVFGSSGSPILNLSNYKIIGFHKGGSLLNLNKGTFVKFIINKFNKECSQVINNKLKKETIYIDTGSKNIKNIQNNIPIMDSMSMDKGMGMGLGMGLSMGMGMINPLEIHFPNSLMDDYRWDRIYDKTNMPILNVSEKKSKINLIFQTTNGKNTNLVLDFGTTVNTALIKYLEKLKRVDLIGKNSLYFLYNAMKIDFNDQTPIEKKFKFYDSPQIMVVDVQDLIGAEQKI